jgi:hypothetical protein
MAVKINNREVVTDARELKIVDMDSDTQGTMRDALRQDNLYIEIQDSNGDPIHRYWGAAN